MKGMRLRFEDIPGKEAPQSSASMRGAVYSTPNGEIVIVGKAAQERVERICAQFVDLMMSYDRISVFAAMQYVLGTMWCNDNETITKTDAIDRWRNYSAGVESVIRNSFGEMKYGRDE